MLLIAATIALVRLSGATESRDPWFWPFSTDSIWNMPIGSKAVFIPAGLTRSKQVGIDHERFVKLGKQDSVRQIYAPSGWQTRWPGDRTRSLGSMPVPDTFVVPDARQGYTPNECCAFLMPDGHTLLQLEPTCRVEKGGAIVGYPREPQDLFGTGIFGTHWGSGLSTLGGSIRLGELTSREPIHHAIKLNVWGERLFYSKDAKGYRWPADRHDSAAAQSYHGKNPKLQMGTLLALPGGLTSQKLGLTTEVGKKLFQAFQDYGAYITDDSGWDDYDLCAELGVEDEVSKTFGIQLATNNGPYFDDLMKIIEGLCIVDNNSEKSIGGGGKPRRPLAPTIRRP